MKHKWPLTPLGDVLAERREMPSKEDLEITRQLVEAGRLIGIPLHDHLIVAGDSYTSFAEHGLI